MLVFTLAAAVLILALSLVVQILERRYRAARFHSLVLKPNVLLTRFPIVFVAGPRTVFRLFDHWNSVPLYLREHGFEVYVVEPAGLSREARTESVLSALNALGRCHLIADGSLEADLEAVATLRPREAVSFTVVKTADRERFVRGGLSPRDLKPSLIDAFYIEGSAAGGFVSRAKLVLLMAHNFLIQRRTQFVHPFETAEVSRQDFASEERFLDLAISLAERDFRN